MCFCLASFPAATPSVTFYLTSYSESLICIWPKLFFATPCSGQAAEVQGGIQGLLQTVMWWKKFEWIMLFKNDKAIKRHAGHPKGMPAIPSCFIAHTVHFFYGHCTGYIQRTAWIFFKKNTKKDYFLYHAYPGALVTRNFTWLSPGKINK